MKVRVNVLIKSIQIAQLNRTQIDTFDKYLHTFFTLTVSYIESRLQYSKSIYTIEVDNKNTILIIILRPTLIDYDRLCLKGRIDRNLNLKTMVIIIIFNLKEYSFLCITSCTLHSSQIFSRRLP